MYVNTCIYFLVCVCVCTISLLQSPVDDLVNEFQLFSYAYIEDPTLITADDDTTQEPHYEFDESQDLFWEPANIEHELRMQLKTSGVEHINETSIQYVYCSFNFQ